MTFGKQAFNLTFMVPCIASTAVADSFSMNSRTQKILCCIVAILLLTDAAARLCDRRALQRWYLKIQDLLFQMLCRSFTYHVQFRKYRRTKLSPSFLITLYIPIYIQKYATLHSLFISGNCSICFGWYLHPSSGAHTTVSIASGICHTVTATCRYRGGVPTPP